MQHASCQPFAGHSVRKHPRRAAGKTSKNIPSQSVNFATSTHGNFCTSLLPHMEISVQFHENLLSNNSTRIPLLPPHHFALSLCIKWKWESFWKSSWRNALPVFKIDLFNDSDNDEQFFSFHAEDIVLLRSFNVNNVSIHWTGVIDSNADWDEDITIRTGGAGERSRLTIDSPKEFTVRTRISTNLDVADASQLDFFYRLFTPKLFCYNSSANEPVCLHNNHSSTKPALQEVNKQPCCAQQRVNTTIWAKSMKPKLQSENKQ